MKAVKMKSNFMKTITTMTILLLATGKLFAWGESNPRAIAMGGAYNALAFGYEAPNYNPANLGLSYNNDKFTINLFSIGVNIRNNSFSLKDYNNYTGKYLTDDDKNTILDKIPDGGMQIDALVEATALSISYNSFALNIHSVGVSKANIDKDLIEILFCGNAVRPEASFEDISGEGLAIADISLSYGHQLSFESLKPFLSHKELSVGATFHYLRGLTYFDVISAEGNFTTTDTSLISDGTFIVQTAMGGTGFAIDLGAAMVFDSRLIFKDDIIISLSLENLLSSIKWNKDTENLQLDFAINDFNYDNLTDSLLSDSLIESNDTTIAISSFSTNLPTVLRIGASTSINKIKLAFDWEQGITSGVSQSTTPRLSLGGEYKPVNFLPLRAGCSIGGGRDSMFSAGLGLHFNPCRFDLALANNGSILPGRSKGLVFAAALGFWF